MTATTAAFPAHPAFAPLGEHFASLDRAAASSLARRQSAELGRQWRIASGRRPPSEHKARRQEYDTIIARMGRDDVDAADLLALIAWLDEVAQPQRSALNRLDASLSEIAQRDDIARHQVAA